MKPKHENFDAGKVSERKDDFCGYRFCPLCGNPLVLKHLDGLPRKICDSPECGFIYYQNPVPAAAAIIVENDRVLLVKRAHPPKINWWCLPAGFMEWSEHPSDTAVRELEEETGLKVRLTGFFEVYTGKDDPRVNAVLLLYLADVIGGRLQASDDALEVKFFGFDEIPDKIAFESHRRALDDYSRRFRSSPNSSPSS
ncbi:MAG: NUDIX hydrolase [Candidatus Zixiibacteriota bacterium]|nr:MAG: NUDIX hydrolase [candidate division Zixibacteria bacterium]